jgi:hypothetical protein
MFPMPLVFAANHLRSRGYDCRPASQEVLIRNGTVTPTDPVTRGLMDNFGIGDNHWVASEDYRTSRAMAYALMMTFGMWMAAEFLPVRDVDERVVHGSITALITAYGFAFRLILLLAITDFAWIALFSLCGFC